VYLVVLKHLFDCDAAFEKTSVFSANSILRLFKSPRLVVLNVPFLVGEHSQLMGSTSHPQVTGECGSAPTAMGRWSLAVLVGSAALDFGTGHGEVWIFCRVFYGYLLGYCGYHWISMFSVVELSV
jgi:hypothetical protein